MNTNSIGQRLRQLRSETGSRSADEETGSLGERVGRLRRRSRRPVDAAVALNGRWIDDGVVVLESEEPLGWRGKDAGWCELADVKANPRWTFVDTETTGLSGGVGTSVFLFGAGQYRDGVLRIRQFLLARPGAEAAFWNAVQAELRPEGTVVSYNGKAFDWPLIEARQRLSRCRVSRPGTHLDLLHWVRRAFGGQWPDCRLSTCETRLLALRREGDLPGSHAPIAYRDFLREGRVDWLRRIVVHHRQDIASLAHLLPVLGSAYRRPARFGANAIGIARWWARRGRYDRAIAILKGDHSFPARRELGFLLRRDGRWAAARTCWESLARTGDPVALESLAKYHEHQERAPEQALRYCRRLVASWPEESRHRHRLLRLLRKSGAQP